MTSDERIFSVGEAANEIGISYFNLRYYIRCGKVPPPHITANGARRYYREREVEEIRLQLAGRETHTKGVI